MFIFWQNSSHIKIHLMSKFISCQIPLIGFYVLLLHLVPNKFWVSCCMNDFSASINDQRGSMATLLILTTLLNVVTMVTELIMVVFNDHCKSKYGDFSNFVMWLNIVILLDVAENNKSAVCLIRTSQYRISEADTKIDIWFISFYHFLTYTHTAETSFPVSWQLIFIQILKFIKNCSRKIYLKQK